MIFLLKIVKQTATIAQSGSYTSMAKNRGKQYASYSLCKNYCHQAYLDIVQFFNTLCSLPWFDELSAKVLTLRLYLCLWTFNIPS